MEWVLIKTLFSLAAVLGLMVGVVFLLKKFVYGTGAPSAAQVDITVLGSRSLSPKKSISVVRVMGKVLVVGLSEQGMSLLTELENEEAAESDGHGPADVPDKTPGVIRSGPFAAYLGRSIARLLAKDRYNSEGRVSVPQTPAEPKIDIQSTGKPAQRRRKVRSNYA
jgi:flagellar biosynthetic protein FliO